MATLSEFPAHCTELLGSLGPTRVKRMFGGYGFYVDDVFIAVGTNDRLYLKTDEQTRPRFEAAGSEPFVFEAEGKQVTTSYWAAPDDAMESPALMWPWARLAMEAALRTRNAKPVKKKATAKAKR